MRQQRLLFFFLLAFAFLITLGNNTGQAQCTTCNFTAATNGSYNLTGNQTICVTGNVGDFTMNVSGTGNKICIAPGATWTISSGINFSANLTFDVYGTLNANGSYNVNTGAKPVFNVYTGATMNTNTGGFSNGIAINNDGTLNFTAPASTTISNTGSFSLINSATGVVSATVANSYFVFGQNGYVENSGLMTFSNLENSESDIRNLAGGTINIGRRFFNHGNIIDDGRINTLCGAFGTVACEFIVGDKGPGKTFTITSTGCMNVVGNTTFNGPGFVNGTLEITGNLDIIKPVSGTGRVIVNNGVSTIAISGGYTVSKFCDKNTAGNKFDVVNANSPATTVVYTVDCSANTCSTSTPSCAQNIVLTLGPCNTATNQYSISGTVSFTNAVAGSMTITDGAKSTTVAVTAGATSVAYSLTGLTSGSGSHTVVSILTGCGTDNAVYTAPASCTVAPCGLALTVTPGLCLSANNTYVLSGSVVATNLPVSGTITITSGAFATRTISVPAGNASGPLSYSGLISNGQTYTVTASYSNSACSPISQTYTAPASCSVAPVCSISAVASAGICATATNTYSATVAIALTNAPAGTITVSIPGSAPISQILAANTSSFTAVFAGLVSDGSSHTATISLPGCGTTTATFTAPVACSVAPVCSISAVVTAGLCSSATNTFSTTTVVTLTNPTVGILTITDGPASQTFATTAVTTATFTAVFAGIPSDGASHTLTAALPNCGALTKTYTAPASCSATPVCSLSATVTAGLCASATNTYSATAVVVVKNPTAGVLAVSTGGQSITFVTTTAASATFVAVFSSLLSDGVLHNVITSLPGCSTTTTPYTAPASCSVTPVCNLSLTASGSACNPVTNLYVLSGSITLTNSPVSQTLTLTDGSYVRSLTAAAGTTTITFSYTTLQSDGLVHTVTLVSSATACGVASTTYTAPASCSVAPVCSVSAVVTAGLCSTATNTYSSTVLVTMTNPTAGLLTVLDGVRSVTLAVPATLGTVTTSAIFNDLVSDGSVHPVSVSLTGCSGTSTTYTAPASCTVCSLSITTSALANGQISSAYSQTLTISGATVPVAFAVKAGSLPTGLTLNPTTGVISGTPTAPAGTASFTISVTDGKNCSAVAPLTITTSALPVCSLTATATPGTCNSATNAYTLTGTVSGINTPANQSLTISVGSSSTVVTLTGNGPVSYTLTGLNSDGLTQTVSVISSATACGLASVTYTAPASCTVALPTITVVVGTPICNSLTNQYTATGTVNVTNVPAGSTVTLTDNGISVTATSATSIEVGWFTYIYSLTGVSNAASHTVVASVNSLTASTTYLAPVSCTVCSTTLTSSSLPRGKVGNAYSATLTATNGTAPYSFSVSGGSLPTGLTLNPTTGVISGTPTVSAPFPITIAITDASGCVVRVPLTVIQIDLANVCALNVQVTPGLCLSATNQYSISGTVSLTSTIAGTLTITDGAVSTSVTVTASTTSVAYSLSGLSSGSGSHTVTASLSDCSLSSAIYMAPVSCSVALKASLGDYVWLDTNQNGVQDATESGVASVTVTLCDATSGAAISSTLTDGAGKYLFTNLNPGTYVVKFTAPTGTTFTTPNSTSATPGTDSNVTSLTGQKGSTQPVSLSAGDNNLTIDAGLIPVLGSIGDFVWKDLNKNGQQDSGEPGANGITIRLLEQTTPGTFTLVATTVTAGGGGYLFTNLPLGTYVVEIDKFTLPATCTISPNVTVGNPTTDSDTNPDTGRSGLILVDPTDPTKRTILTIDTGLETSCQSACVPISVTRVR